MPPSLFKAQVGPPGALPFMPGAGGGRPRQRFKLLTPALVLGFLLLCVQMAAAQARPRVVAILCDGLTVADLQSPDGAALEAWARRGAFGVMNDVAPGPRSFLSATLTLATGQEARGEPPDAAAYSAAEAAPGEHGAVRDAYARRMGYPVSAWRGERHAIWHLGIPGLERRNLAGARLGAALAAARPTVEAELYGSADNEAPDRRAALLTVDSEGIGRGETTLQREQPGSPFGIADDPLRAIQAIQDSGAGLIVVDMGDLARAEAARAHLSPAAYRRARRAAVRRLSLLVAGLEDWVREHPRADLLIVSACPPAESERFPVPWTRLTPIIAAGSDFPPGLLTSPTTRTPGLVANVDFAPTVLHLFGVPVPATMVGRPMAVTALAASSDSRLETVRRKEFVSALNESVKAWGLAPLTLICLALIGAGMVLRRRRRFAAARRLAGAIVLLQSLTAATLLAPILIPPTAEEYTLRIAAWMAALALASFGIARLLRISPPVGSGLLLIGILGLDIVTGQTLQKDSALCSNAVSGLRYYGIGNEYLGPLLASALSGLFAMLDDRGVPFPPAPRGVSSRVAVGCTWIGLALLLGWPGWGANAGSLACTGAGFGVGFAILCGRRVTMGLAAASVAAGLALAFGFGIIDAARSGGASSHFGAALQASTAGGRGAGYLAEIVVRKIGMNLHLLVSPPFWALAALALLPVALGNALVGGPLRRALARRPWSTRGIAATLATIVAALLFKDSGVVTAAGLFAVSCACPLYYTLADREDSEVGDANVPASSAT